MALITSEVHTVCLFLFQSRQMITGLGFTSELSSVGRAKTNIYLSSLACRS